jgi:hypothetical protein
MTHRSTHSESYKPTEADTPLAHASDEFISYDQNQLFAQVLRVLARPLDVTRWHEMVRHLERIARARATYSPEMYYIGGVHKSNDSSQIQLALWILFCWILYLRLYVWYAEYIM